MKITKRKTKCPCCGASGYSYSEPYLSEEYKHLTDRSWVPEEAEGADTNLGTSWVSSCFHKTGRKIKLEKTWEEYECNCTFPD